LVWIVLPCVLHLLGLIDRGGNDELREFDCSILRKMRSEPCPTMAAGRH
jgi:hypothetical protein